MTADESSTPPVEEGKTRLSGSSTSSERASRSTVPRPLAGAGAGTTAQLCVLPAATDVAGQPAFGHVAGEALEVAGLDRRELHPLEEGDRVTLDAVLVVRLRLLADTPRRPPGVVLIHSSAYSVNVTLRELVGGCLQRIPLVMARNGLSNARNRPTPQ